MLGGEEESSGERNKNTDISSSRNWSEVRVVIKIDFFFF